MKTVIRAVATVALAILITSSLAFFVMALTPQKERLVITVERVEPTVLERINAKELARELLTSKSYKCLAKLIGKESAWDPSAKNPRSSAKGIGQLLDATYDNLGMKHSSNENAQLIATLAYIGRKYGSGGPCAAWAFFQRHNYF